MYIYNTVSLRLGTMRLVIGFLTLATIAVCQPLGITLQALEGRSLTITLEDLSKLPQHTIKTEEHSSPVVFEGVLVMDILAKVGIPAGEKLRGEVPVSISVSRSRGRISSCIFATRARPCVP